MPGHCPTEQVQRSTVTVDWVGLAAGKTNPDATDLKTKPANFSEQAAALQKIIRKKASLARSIDPCEGKESGCTFQAGSSSSTTQKHTIFVDKGTATEASIDVNITVSMETGVCLDLW